MAALEGELGAIRRKGELGDFAGREVCEVPVRLMSSCGIDMSRMREMRIVNAGRIAVNAPRSSAFLRKPNAIRVQAGSNDALGKCFKLLAIGLEFFFALQMRLMHLRQTTSKERFH